MSSYGYHVQGWRCNPTVIIFVDTNVNSDFNWALSS
jgi:hypothetical protein